MARPPGVIRDAIINYMTATNREVSLPEIRGALSKHLGDVAPSSVRSYLNLNLNTVFERTGRGKYRLKERTK